MVEADAHPVEQARDDASRGEYQRAYDRLMEADAAEPLPFEGLALLAEMAYAVGHLEVTFEAWERAHAQAVTAGDDLAAAFAAARIGMHLMMDTGLLSPVRVWLKRAEHLLGDAPDTPAHAWLALARSYERLLSGDFAAAGSWARRAVEVGRSQGEPTPAGMGQVAEARGLILAGEIDAGLERLDEAAAVTVSGELDPVAVGLVYCELVCAWQGLAQYDRAEEWTEAMERWCQRHTALGSVHGRCRVHRAEILRLRGPCGDAEREAQLACEELRPILRREFGWPLTELGLVRLQAGDLAGAEDAFLRAREAGWEPQPGLALLRLAQGDAGAAAASIRDALDHPLDIPSKELPPNTELRRAPLLAAQAEICVAAGDLDQARAAADELARVASAFSSRALQASADSSCGMVRLATGDVAAARRAFERAVRAWSELTVPYEAARARVGLAQAHDAEGNHGHAAMERRAAASTFERIGATLQAALAASGAGAGDRPGGGTVAMPAPLAGGAGNAAPLRGGPTEVFRAEGEYWSVGFAGRTVRIRDLKGLRYLARLLAEPGREFHVLDLVAAEHGASGTPSPRPEPGLGQPGDAGALLDARAKDAYRRRLAEIDEDIAEAEAFGDDERVARATVDREFLVRELARAVGLGGRDRRAGDDSERARVSVTRAIRHALGRISEHHPQLGEHLDHAVHTGTYCAYRPDPRVPVTWEL
ncbi:MAG TPA: hypothetical protein VFZ68_05925 [Acidimicrobiales bacterium]